MCAPRELKVFRKLFSTLVFVILFPLICFAGQPVEKEYPYIMFLGAAQSIGGSAILIDTGETRFLIDYGLYYDKSDQEKNREVLENLEKLNFVLLTHAHIDHSGRLPMLYKNGFKGPVIGTDATKDITGRMLVMSLEIGENQGIELFNHNDLSDMMEKFKTVNYGEIVRLSSDINVRFNEAGHILGSSIIEIWIRRDNKSIKIVAGGDMGGRDVPILRDRAQIDMADYVIIESTYGDSDKERISYSTFEKDIRETLERGGSVLIPAFVLEKTQKVIYILCEMKRKGIIPAHIPIYSDSSTANDITKIYRRYSKYYDSDAKRIISRGQDPLSCKGLKEVPGKIALVSHENRKPSIYISSSGMLEHANSPKHLEAMISDPKNLLALVGWQAPGTPGRNLQEGCEVIDIPIENWVNGKLQKQIITRPVHAKVKKYDVFSSHADGCEIMTWLTGFKAIGEVFVIHGEQNTTIQFAKRIENKLKIPASAPAENDVIFLKFDLTKTNPTKAPGMCDGMRRNTEQAAPTDQ
jgi:metallo-beta-lactamase family protein